MLQKNRRINPTLYKAACFNNPELYEVLPDDSWKGKPCFIIGGGPSLEGFDWSRLKGKRTIGINRAFERFEPTIIFSMDTRFLAWLERGEYGPEMKKRLIRSSAYKVWQCTYTAQLPAFIYIIKVHKDYYTGCRAFTESLKIGIGHGDNSGYGALNVACCLGANPIYLLGYDLKHENGKSHWHEGHPAKQKEEAIEKWIGHFGWAAPLIKSRGFRVINLNPNSALECFEKRKMEGIL